MAFLKSLLRDEEGQDLVEYALLVSLIAVGVILALTTIGTKISSSIANSGSKLTFLETARTIGAG